jgi:hypothetical protein
MGRVRAKLSSFVTIEGMLSRIESTLYGSSSSCWEYKLKKCFLAATLIPINSIA